MASEVLISISRDEVERARLMSEYKYVTDHQSKMVQAKREGRAEGFTEAINLIKSGKSPEEALNLYNKKPCKN